MADSRPVCLPAVWERRFMPALPLASFLFGICIPWQVESPVTDCFRMLS